MVSLTRTDLEDLLAFLRVGERFSSIATFERGVLPELRRLVPCETIGWNEVDIASGET